MPYRIRIAPLLLLGLGSFGPGCKSSGSGAMTYSSDECSDACSRVASASCGDVGQSCFDSCVSYPNAQFQGACQTQLKLYFDCWWQAESYLCDEATHGTTPVGCDAQRETYSACAEPDGADGAGGMGGAGGAPNTGGASEAGGASPAGGTDSAGAGGAEGEMVQ